MTPAIFFDRDGTILENRRLLTCAADVEFIPGVVDALRSLKRRFRLFILANDSLAGKGALTRQQVNLVNGHMLRELHRDGICIEELYACPGAKGDCCKCHKPSSQFLLDAAKRYGLDMSQSWTVGDHPHDAELGRRAGGKGIVVLTGHGQKHRSDIPKDVPVAFDLGEAARIMFAGMQ